jgi:hypothetical protein
MDLCLAFDQQVRYLNTDTGAEEPRAIEALRAGDKVIGAANTSTDVLFIVNAASGRLPMRKLLFGDTGRTLTLTPDHIVRFKKTLCSETVEYEMASVVVIGNHVQDVSGKWREVVSIEEVRMHGMSPITRSSLIEVNGVIASSLSSSHKHVKALVDMVGPLYDASPEWFTGPLMQASLKDFVESKYLDAYITRELTKESLSNKI